MISISLIQNKLALTRIGKLKNSLQRRSGLDYPKVIGTGRRHRLRSLLFLLFGPTGKILLSESPELQNLTLTATGDRSSMVPILAPKALIGLDGINELCSLSRFDGGRISLDAKARRNILERYRQGLFAKIRHKGKIAPLATLIDVANLESILLQAKIADTDGINLAQRLLLFHNVAAKPQDDRLLKGRNIHGKRFLERISTLIVGVSGGNDAGSTLLYGRLGPGDIGTTAGRHHLKDGKRPAANILNLELAALGTIGQHEIAKVMNNFVELCDAL